MKRVVQFDMDGVLADFGTGYRRLYRQLTERTLPPTSVWDDLTDIETWNAIKASTSFWYSLPALVNDSTLRNIQLLQERGNEIYFVTHRMGSFVKAQSQDWLSHHGIANPAVIVSGKKAEVARAIGATHAIDDKFGNAYFISCYSPETKSYLLDAPWNQADHSVVGGRVIRIKSVDDFLKEIEE